MAPTITLAVILPCPHTMREMISTGRYADEVWAWLSNGTYKKLFSFYADEITFTADELVGLTEAGASALHMEKDLAYLRS